MSIQPLEAAVDRVQPLFVGPHACDRSEVLESGGFCRPGYTRRRVDITNAALHLLIAAEPGQLQRQSSDGCYTHTHKGTHSMLKCFPAAP